MASRRTTRGNEPRDIIVKYAGACHTCGGTIARGSRARYFPGNPGRIVHLTCAAGVDPAVNDYAGDGLDSRYEDSCADICGR